MLASDNDNSNAIFYSNKILQCLGLLCLLDLISVNTETQLLDGIKFLGHPSNFSPQHFPRRTAEWDSNGYFFSPRDNFMNRLSDILGF